MFEILEKKSLNKTITKIKVHAPYIAKAAKPGQFVIIRVNETGERIPLTIADYDLNDNSITLIYQKVGFTTKLLDTLNTGDKILDIAGPLGKVSKLEGYKNAAVIGGGAGCAIAYPQAKALFKLGTKVDIIAGFKNKDLIILEDEMKNCSNNLTITTDDGSNGNKGFVTDALNNKLEDGKRYDLVVAVGPIFMMKAVSEITKKFNIKTIVSMNSLMIDGTGMCGCCRLTYDKKTKFACIDGPDFDAHKIDFDETARKLNMYKAQEQSFDELNCNLFKN